MDAHDVFEVLVREHLPMLATYARCLDRSPAAADDIVQETLIAAWQNLAQFDRSRPFAPWLRGIAANVARQQRRPRAGAAAPCDPAELDRLEQCFGALHEQPGDDFDAKLQALRACLDALPETYREAIAARYRDGLHGPALAARLAATVEAVKKRLQRGRDLLLGCIQGKLFAEPAR